MNAIKTKDDLSLITYTQDIMSIQNVVYASIIASDGTILAHSKTSEIGKKNNNSVSDNRAFPKLTIQLIQKDDNRVLVYDFYQPLISESLPGIAEKAGFINLGLNMTEYNKANESFMEKMILLPVFVVLIGSMLAYLFSNLWLNPIQRIKEMIDRIISTCNSQSTTELSGTGQLQINNDFCEIISSVNNLVITYNNRFADQQKEINSLNSRFITYMQKIGTCFDNGLVLTDSGNRVVYINDSGRKMLYTSDKEHVIGKHLFDITRNYEFVDLIKKSGEQNNVVIHRIVDATIKILAIKDEENRLIGTVIST
jgi:sensor histidine kinase regulating citrate/malate metabolism